MIGCSSDVDEYHFRCINRQETGRQQLPMGYANVVPAGAIVV
jgi:hypothetical protein